MAVVCLLTRGSRRLMGVTIGALRLVCDVFDLIAAGTVSAAYATEALAVSHISLIGVGLGVELLRFVRQRAPASADDRLQSFDHAAKAMLLVTLDGRIEQINRQFEKLTGHRREALIGQPLSALDIFSSHLVGDGQTALGHRLAPAESLEGV